MNNGPFNVGAKSLNAGAKVAAVNGKRPEPPTHSGGCVSLASPRACNCGAWEKNRAEPFCPKCGIDERDHGMSACVSGYPYPAPMLSHGIENGQVCILVSQHGKDAIAMYLSHEKAMVFATGVATCANQLQMTERETASPGLVLPPSAQRSAMCRCGKARGLLALGGTCRKCYSKLNRQE